jgi:hypothetical protein
LHILPFSAVLQVEVATAVEEVQVHHGMQPFGAAVGLGPAHTAYHLTLGIHLGKYFGGLVGHYKSSLHSVYFHTKNNLQKYDFFVKKTKKSTIDAIIA